MNEKQLSARFVFFHVNRQKFRSERKIVKCEICVSYYDLLLTERNFAVKEKLFSARFVFFHVNREISQFRKNG